MALSPLNDLAKISLDDKKYGWENNDSATAESGILVELPDVFNYFGFWSFAFEVSFMDEEKLKKLHAYWKKRIGKRVYWTALSEKGNIIELDGQRYAFVKFTSLIASDDADAKGHNLHSDGAGSFSV
jgi:hypothetical protein